MTNGKHPRRIFGDRRRHLEGAQRALQVDDVVFQVIEEAHASRSAFGRRFVGSNHDRPRILSSKDKRKPAGALRRPRALQNTKVQWPVAARFCGGRLGAAGLGAAAAVAVASFGRGRGSGTSANLPAFASGVAVSGAGFGGPRGRRREAHQRRVVHVGRARHGAGRASRLARRRRKDAGRRNGGGLQSRRRRVNRGLRWRLACAGSTAGLAAAGLAAAEPSRRPRSRLRTWGWIERRGVRIAVHRRVGAGLALGELGDLRAGVGELRLGALLGRAEIDGNGLDRAGPLLDQRRRLAALGGRLESRKPCVSLSSSASSAAGRLRCGPHISSRRSGGATLTGCNCSTEPSDGVSQDSAPRLKPRSSRPAALAPR